MFCCFITCMEIWMYMNEITMKYFVDFGLGFGLFIQFTYQHLCEWTIGWLTQFSMCVQFFFCVVLNKLIDVDYIEIWWANYVAKRFMIICQFGGLLFCGCISLSIIISLTGVVLYFKEFQTPF